MADAANQSIRDSSSPVVEALPAVTWLIATHVADAHLRASLQSCLAQTFTDFECLVIVNGDAVNEVAKQVQEWFGHDVRLRVRRTSVRHLNFSLSLGLHLARAPLVARMDADDISLPDRLERQVAFMHAHRGVAVLGSQYDVIDSKGKIIQHMAMPTTHKAIKKRLMTGNPFCHPSVMFRRDVVLLAGGYLGGLYAEDYDLWARLCLNPRNEFANLAHTCLQYRSDGVGNARGARLAYATMGAAQFKNFVAGSGWRWGVAALISWCKAVFKAKP